MHIKNRYIKTLFKAITIISIFECLYLFALPAALNNPANKDFVNKLVNNNDNVQITYLNPKFKTHIKPNITLSLDNLNIKDRNSNTIFLDTDNLDIEISLFPLLFKQIDFKHIYANNLDINILRDSNGIFNIEKLFPKTKKQNIKIKYKNSTIKINGYTINSLDEQLNQAVKISGTPLNIKLNKKNEISIKTKGQLAFNDAKNSADSSAVSESKQESLSDFDIDLKTKFPFIYQDFNQNTIDGECFFYNINLEPFLPFIKRYINNNITKLSGNIEYIQLSAEQDENGKNNIVFNSKFNNIIFDKSDWQNYVDAKGENKFDTNIELNNNTIDIKSLNYKADNVNIKSDGKITLDKKPILNINAEIKESRAENIASILPPNLVPQQMTIEKVKKYGVFGDIDAKLHIQGKIPQPDITGYVKGRNVKVLDKKIHPLHKGSVDIVFDKRILNMDILVELFDNQKAHINGCVHMFRDGINNVTIKTTNNIDFPLAQKIVIPISKVFNFQLGPIPEMNITSGKGIIDINVQGSMDFVSINGYSAFDKAKLTYNGLYGEVIEGKGRLDFKDDVISFKSERAFVKNNPLNVEGKVRINKDLNFNISSNKAEANDLLEVINNSELLKDVKEGLVIIKKAAGPTKLFVNMKAKIVPVPFGQAPLPPDEAFEDMKVKGSLYLLGNSCTIEGFYTPIENIKGIVDFTETNVDIHDIEGTSGTSPITIGGKIINDLNTKIPDVDITITSKSVNLKDTIKFLAESYLYPPNYPDLSPLYNIASKHDLYFKYKAKSIDFLTDKAYAVMNFINDDTDSALKAKNGTIIMDKATVKVQNVNAALFDSDLKINGEVKNVDTLNPIYNLTVKADNFNLENLNSAEKLNIIPKKMENLLTQFSEFKGFADIDIGLNHNILNGSINLSKPQFTYTTSGIPFIFDDFIIKLKDNKIIIDNIAADIAKMPFFGNIRVQNIYKTPDLQGYFTAKVTDDFISNYFPKEISKRVHLEGDVNLSSELSGNENELNLKPKITLNPDADVIIDGVSLGEVNDKREFKGNLNINKNKITLKKLDYVKYVSSQNNIVYPILFATINGVFNISPDNIIEPEELNIKTYKNLSAKVLNVLLKHPILKQGTFNCNLKYKFDSRKKLAKLYGNMDCRNLDIPLFDTIVKNIKLKADDENIDINLFGFMNDSKINITSLFKNNLYEKPEILSLKLSADQLDNNKLLRSLTKVRQAMQTNNEIKNTDLTGIKIKNGWINVNKLTVKSLVANDLSTSFSIDEQGILHADDINVIVGEGNIEGNLSYDLNNSKFKGNFELTNVDSNYVAETLFDGKNQIYGQANGKIILETQGLSDEDIIRNLKGFVYFDISDGRMPKLGSLEYLLRASNILKSGITGFTINSILELLNLVKTGYFSNINGSCTIENGVAQNIEIFSKGENLSLYMHGSYDISKTSADMEILGKLSKKISTIFGSLGNTSLNTFFRLIPGISMLDFGRKDFVEDVEKIPSFTNGDYESRVFQAIINGDINESGYVQSFKWVK